MQNRGTATCDAVAAETISRAGLWPYAAWDPSHRWDECVIYEDFFKQLFSGLYEYDDFDYRCCIVVLVG